MERLIQMIGGASRDPRAFSQVLMDNAQRVDRSFRNAYTVIHDKPFSGDIGTGTLNNPFLYSADSPIATGEDAPLSPQERTELERLRRLSAPRN
jgi:hypothetical protein